MAIKFPVAIDYSQVVVFCHGLSNPGLLWEDAHVAQGFSWDNETVSFGVSDTDENCLIDVDLADNFDVSPDAISALSVPFTAISDKVDIGSVGFAEIFTLPPGTYTLFFETLPSVVDNGDPYDFVFRIRFVPTSHPEFKILKSGGQVQTEHVLRTSAQRA